MAGPAPPSHPWSRRAEALAAVGFWLVLGLLSVLRRAMGPWHPEGLPIGDIVETLAEYGMWALLTPVVFWVARRWPAEREARVGRLAAQVALGVGAALAIEAATRGLLRPLLADPVAATGAGGGPPAWTLGGAFRGLWFLDEFVIYLAVLAVGYTRHAMLRLRERQAEAERLLAEQAKLQAQLSEARLSALRMQLNPHFLFNTLNAVSALVERDPAGVRTMIARLSSLLRRVLDDGGAAEVPLRDELAFIRDYLDVQRVRFQDRLEVEESIAPEAVDALVPPLLLQPLVENAVGHGVRRIEEGVGEIRLVARVDGGRLRLSVEDNGPGLDGGDGQAGGGGVGLSNTRARLHALYGDDAELALRERAGRGAVAEVVLPFRPAPVPAEPAHA
jgi:signal transduction histidine kinase